MTSTRYVLFSREHSVHVSDATSVASSSVPVSVVPAIAVAAAVAAAVEEDATAPASPSSAVLFSEAGFETVDEAVRGRLAV